LFSPIIAFLSLVKFFADVASWVILVASFVAGFCIGLVVVALSWIFYRPWVAFALIAISGLIFGGLYYYSLHQNAMKVT
jgi:uncharacterized membrane protein